MNSSSQEKKNKKFSSVFIYSSIIAAIVVIIGAVWPEKFDSVTNTAKMWITNNLGWYYLILTTVIVFFCVFLIFSPIGKLKLGNLMTNQNLIQFLGSQCYSVLVWGLV